MSGWGNTGDEKGDAWGSKDSLNEKISVDNQAVIEDSAAGNEEVPTSAPVTAPPTEHKNPQAAGWVEKVNYDYELYNKSAKELKDESAASGVTVGDWASNAAKYEWNEEYGDVGPKFKELEEQLFGSEFRMKKGIQFEKIKSINVLQEGTVKIDPVRSFEDAGLHPIMLENVKLAGYEVPTPIQAYCLPAILKGHDVVACAQTGSGKTAAFLIPTLSKLMGKAKKLGAPRPNPATFRPGIDTPIRAEPLMLIVCPSRELAVQIFDEARRFCYRSMLRPCVLYGGGPVVEQMVQLQKGCDVLIATPGRLCDFIERPHVLSLQRLKYTIIDEADEMLQSDWETELGKIMAGGDQEVGNITYMMFSATFPKSARDLAKEHLAHDHVRIRVGRAGSTHLNIKQNVVYVASNLKRQALIDLIYANPPARTIIFVNSKRTCDEIDDYLFNLDLPTTSIHSDRTQREREDALRAFRTGKCPILVATGVSARGLDIHNVMHVINFDLPSTQYGGIEEYTHRIGRTGRIGNEGLATSFYNDRDEDLAEVLTKTLLETNQDIPEFLQHHVPVGGIADLHFDADSDDEAEENATVAGGGWGAPVVAAISDPAATGGLSAQVPIAMSTPVAPDDLVALTPAIAPKPFAGTGWGSATQDVGPSAASGGWGTAAVPATSAPDAAPKSATTGWDAPSGGNTWESGGGNSSGGAGGW